MKKAITKILIILLCLVISNVSHVYHLHADDVVCPYCGSTNVILVSMTATCTEGGDAQYQCLNTDDPEHLTPVAAGPINTTFVVPVGPLNHDYETTIVKEPTCTEKGSILHKCTRCDDSYSETIAKIDHNYKQVVKSEVSCLKDGVTDFVCTYCNDTYSTTTKALGHNFEEKENVEATCTKDGHILKVCKRCNKEEESILKATGHDVSLTVKKKPTCTEEGLKDGTCKKCNEKFEEIIPSLGHTYPEEWSTVEEASIFKEGSKTKTCIDCGNVVEEVIAKEKIPTSAYVGASAVFACALGLVIYKLKPTKKVVKEISEEAVEKETFEPSFEEKTIVTSIKDGEFYKTLKIQKYIKVVESEFATLKKTISENEPSLTIIDISEFETADYQENLVSIKEELDSPIVSLLVSSKQIKEDYEVLEKLKQEEIIKEYIDVMANPNIILVKLVLPVMKPDLKSDEALENIGMVADALNIPGISSIIDTFISAREAKTTYDEGKEDGLSFVDKSIIISDIASILKLDRISSVSGLISDLDDIKSSLKSKIGGNEVYTTKTAVEDIVEVVNDIINNE